MKSVTLKISKTLLCLVLTCTCYFAKANPDSTLIYIQQIVYPKQDQMRSDAINRLVILHQYISFPFLAAINNNALYTIGDKIVTVAESESAKTNPVYELYPIHRLLQNLKGKQLVDGGTDLHRVEISRADRIQLFPIANWLNINDYNAQKRTIAYGQLPITTDPVLIKFLAVTLKSETDPNCLRAGKEAYFDICLNNAIGIHEAKSFMDSLCANDGDNASGVITTYLQKIGLPKELRVYAQQKATNLNTHYVWLQRMQNLFSGLSLGSILILISLGLAIVYGLAGIINMAHGEFLMVGAYATYTTELFFNNVLHIQNSDWYYLAALPSAFIIAGIGGLLLERVVIRRLYSKPLESLLATWGVSLILIQLARTIFGDLTAVKLPDLLAGGWQIVPHLVLPYSRLFVIVLTIVSVCVLYWVLFSTRLGVQIRAVTQNRSMSACLGIDTRRVDAITFFIGSGLAGLAGCAMTLIGNVVPDMGQTYIVDSFLIVVTGGVGKLVGTIVAGLGIGVFSKVLEAFFEAVYGKVLILLAIMIFMQFKPKGLFPDKARSAED